MQVLKSYYKRLKEVTLPFMGRQKYMHTFDLSDPVMAEGFEDYLNPVKILCAAAGAVDGLAHMTVDETIVAAGRSQRRPGPHVDGCFIPSKMIWGHEEGKWNHYCNDIGRVPIGRMPVIVASSATGCRVWKGEFKADPKSDGDLSHISDQLGEGEIVPAGVGYLLSADCVHESMVLDKPTQRTFLRIALPVGFKT